MNNDQNEACGRCAMSSVVGVAADEQSDEDGATRDPFGSERIEIDETQLRKVSPSAWFGRVTRRLDELATRIVYGR